jgi:hypothetical protein
MCLCLLLIFTPCAPLSTCLLPLVLFVLLVLPLAGYDPFPSYTLEKFTSPCSSALLASTLPMRSVHFKVVRLEIHDSHGFNPMCLSCQTRILRAPALPPVFVMRAAFVVVLVPACNPSDERLATPLLLDIDKWVLTRFRLSRPIVRTQVLCGIRDQKSVIALLRFLLGPRELTRNPTELPRFPWEFFLPAPIRAICCFRARSKLWRVRSNLETTFYSSCPRKMLRNYSGGVLRGLVPPRVILPATRVCF